MFVSVICIICRVKIFIFFIATSWSHMNSCRSSYRKPQTLERSRNIKENNCLSKRKMMPNKLQVPMCQSTIMNNTTNPPFTAFLIGNVNFWPSSFELRAECKGQYCELTENGTRWSTRKWMVHLLSMNIKNYTNQSTRTKQSNVRPKSKLKNIFSIFSQN